MSLILIEPSGRVINGSESGLAATAAKNERAEIAIIHRTREVEAGGEIAFEKRKGGAKSLASLNP